MTLLRTFALLAVVGSAPFAARAAEPATAVAPEPGRLELSAPGSLPVEPTSIFSSGPVPVGDPRWSFRAFSLAGERVEPEVETAEDAPSRTPEPAGLFLLGTGAFATALSIRYRLFAL